MHISHHPFHTCAYCTFSISLAPRDFHTVAENLHDNGSTIGKAIKHEPTEMTLRDGSAIGKAME